MPLSALHYLRRAREARNAAKLCRDSVLRELLRETADAYEELAAGDGSDASGPDLAMPFAPRR